MRQLVLPAFRHLTLREIGVARCDALLKQLGQLSCARSKRAKTVLQLAFGLAVRHEVIPRNPIDGVARLHKPKRTPTALTASEVNAIRAVIKLWEHTRGTSGPNPDGQLGQIVEVMLGTSARIGEVLAIRRCDVDVTTTPATRRICGTIVTERGVGTYRQSHPKTDRSNRIVALPTFTAEALRRRLAVMADRSPDALVFRSRDCTPLTTANVRRQLRRVLEQGGITGVHPAHVPPHCGNGYQRTSERESRRRAPRPHRPEGDDRALHPSERAREPTDCGVAGCSLRHGEAG